MKWLIFWTTDKDIKVKMIIAVEWTTCKAVSYSTKVSQSPALQIGLISIMDRALRPIIEKAWGPFLESPGNFSGPKSNIQIEI